MNKQAILQAIQLVPAMLERRHVIEEFFGEAKRLLQESEELQGLPLTVADVLTMAKDLRDHAQTEHTASGVVAALVPVIAELTKDSEEKPEEEPPTHTFDEHVDLVQRTLNTLSIIACEGLYFVDTFTPVQNYRAFWNHVKLFYAIREEDIPLYERAWVEDVFYRYADQPVGRRNMRPILISRAGVVEFVENAHKPVSLVR